jgi:hypothetical protein
MEVIRTTPTGAMEALTGLSPLDLVIQGEVRSAAHWLWSLGCWSYLHSSRGHSGILMQLQRLDPVFNMGVDVMRPTFNCEPKYRVTILTRGKWNRGPWTPVVKGLILFMDGSRMTGDRGWSLWAIFGKKAQYLCGKVCCSFSGWGICHLGMCIWNSNEC